eukprot:COSAG05_NODE_1463_length_4810_cov_8.316706_6_plen_127_part_00
MRRACAGAGARGAWHDAPSSARAALNSVHTALPQPSERLPAASVGLEQVRSQGKLPAFFLICHPPSIFCLRSWNHFGCRVTEQDVRSAADAFVSTGMKAAGYEYVNVDGAHLSSPAARVRWSTQLE